MRECENNYLMDLPKQVIRPRTQERLKRPKGRTRGTLETNRYSDPYVPCIRSSMAIHTQVYLGQGTYMYVSIRERQKGTAGQTGGMNGQAANILVIISK